MKYYSLLLLSYAMMTSCLLTAQVGINTTGSTPDPSSILHVKGSGGQDFLIDNNSGNVGIGTTTPTEMLDIVGGIKINDGTQGNNKILTSDEDGSASWKTISDVSRGTSSTTSPDGLSGVIPITESVNSTNNYVVPQGVNLYILNIYNNNANNLLVNDLPLLHGNYNHNNGTGNSFSLAMPIIAGSGDIISSSDANEIVINGYYVDDGSGTYVSPFIPGDNFTDQRNGQIYSTVLIGSQCWMAENLNIGTYINASNGQTNNSTIEKYCYNDDYANCTTYGGLYLWDEMMQYVSSGSGIQGICPDSWHLPTDAEWTALTDYLDGTNVAGGKMKETGYEHWNSPNTDATNTSGFTGLPGGLYYNNGGSFIDLGVSGVWWSSTVGSASNRAWDRDIYYNRSDVGRWSSYKTNGYSVRCIKD